MQLYQNCYISNFGSTQKAGPRKAVISLEKGSNLMNLLLGCEAPKSKENILSPKLMYKMLVYQSY